MNTEEILDELSSGRNAIFSSNLNVLLRLCFALTRRLINNNNSVVIVDERRVTSRYIPLDLADKVLMTSSLVEACSAGSGSTIIVVLPKNIKEIVSCKAKNIVLLTRSSRLVDRLGFARFYLKQTPVMGEYVLRSSDKNIYVRIRFTGEYPSVVIGPAGLTGRIYMIIQDLLVTYGEITVKDVVNAVSIELGLNRKQVREQVLRLAKMGYIRIRRKKIELY